MKIEAVVQALEKRFNELLKQGAKRHIVLWFDEEQGFKDVIDEINLENVKIHKLGKNNFATKLLLEEEDLTSHYLVYADYAKPKDNENWLLNIQLYGSEFLADKASIIMNELKINNLSLKPFIKKNIKFFDNQERFRSLQEISRAEWGQIEYELGMISVHCGQKVLSLAEAVKSIFIQNINEHDNKFWNSISKWPGTKTFWEFAKHEFGYFSENPSLKGLFLTILLTTLRETSKIHLPKSWIQYTQGRKNNCQLFIDHWIHHKTDSRHFNRLSHLFADELNIQGHIENWQTEDYQESDVFEIFDQGIIIYIRNALLERHEDYNKYLELISIRRTKHWYDKYQDLYLSLENAVFMFIFKKTYNQGFAGANIRDLFNSYSTKFFKFDQYYRHFYFFYDQVRGDILNELQPEIEKTYTNWFLLNLSSEWLNLLKSYIKEDWPIAGISQQASFYQDNVKSIITKKDREKIFVIISDALRYEAAEELADILNSETRGSTSITSLQGVLPSNTKIGMASLLPFKNLKIDDKGRVIIDGKYCSSTEDREDVLKKEFEASMTCKLSDLMALSVHEAREKTKNQRVIYLYHNTIDAMGDKPQTEKKTFNAVDEAIQELFNAVKKIVNSLNGTNITITADHGFLYNREPLEEFDKIKKEKIKNIDGNRRFLLVSNQENFEGTLKVKMDYILKDQPELSAIVPNGNLRFGIQGGGSNFVHGGASLQEIVIPVITYQHVRKSQAKEVDLNRPVSVELLSTFRKITNNNFTLNFIQTERVSGKLTANTLKIALWDIEKNEKVSQEKILIADKTSEKADEREIKLPLTLRSGEYDKLKNYYLLIMDRDTGIEINRIPFQINITIENIFDDF